jgi:two-component system chemotaxis sensor kinase CheA
VKLDEYRSLFISEARRVGGDVDAVLAIAPLDAKALLRAFHTLKGMSATMDCAAVLLLAHTLEDLSEGVAKGTLPADAALLDLLREGQEGLRGLVDAVERGEDPEPDHLLERRLRDHLKAGGTTAFQIVRQGAEEPAIEPPAEGPRDDDAIGAIAEILAACAALRELDRSATEPARIAQIGRVEQSARRMYRRLAEMRRVRFGTAVPALRAQLRRVCADHGREATLEAAGEDVLVDPDLLLPLQGALAHLVGNAAIHGIEPPAARLRAGKAPAGRIQIRVESVRGALSVEVSDDGCGLDTARLRATAGAPDADAGELAMRAGITTAATVDAHAGRGVGLPAVAHAIARLGGTVTLTNAPGAGVRVALEIPVPEDLAEVILVEAGGQTFGVLTRAARPSATERPDAPPLLDLPVTHNATLERSPAPRGAGGWVRVDRILGTVEAIVRPPPFPLSALPALAGTTVAPDGAVLFVVDPGASDRSEAT